ncbi:hypothetical protein OAQ99_08000, partial [Candidatus Kapabacteria bacterium]|nr:hypothetical protein [Candidatus Kapabacteria bacterium]
MKILFTIILLFTAYQSSAKLLFKDVIQQQNGAQIRNIEYYDNNLIMATGFSYVSNSEFYGLVAVSKDGGSNWQIDYYSNMLLFGLEIYSENDAHLSGYFATNKAILLESSDFGLNWNYIICDGNLAPDVTSIYHITHIDDNTLLAFGYDRSILKSTDHGETWNKKFSKSGSSMLNMFEMGDKIVVVAQQSDENGENEIYTYYSSKDSGDTWKLWETNLNEEMQINDLIKGTKGELYGFGSQDGSYAVFKSSDLGDTWELAYKDNSEGALFRGHKDTQGRIFAGGENGKIVYSLDGEVWMSEEAPNTIQIWDVNGFGENTYISTASGRIIEIIIESNGINGKEAPNTIYPNPANDYIKIGVEASSMIEKVKIIDIYGNKQ